MSSSACLACGKPNPPQTCSGCRLVSFCDVSCQRSSWKAHKSACKLAVVPSVYESPFKGSLAFWPVPLSEMRASQKAVDETGARAAPILERALAEVDAKARRKGLCEALGAYGWDGLSLERCGVESQLPEDMEKVIDSYLVDERIHKDFQRRELADCLVAFSECSKELGNEDGRQFSAVSAFVVDGTCSKALEAMGEEEIAGHFDQFRDLFKSDAIGLIACNLVGRDEADKIAVLSQQWGWKQLRELSSKTVKAVASLVPFGSGVWLNVLLEPIRSGMGGAGFGEEEEDRKLRQKYFHFSRASESGGSEVDSWSGGSGAASKKAVRHAELVLPKVLHLLRSEMGVEVSALELGQGLKGLAEEESGQERVLFPEEVHVYAAYAGDPLYAGDPAEI